MHYEINGIRFDSYGPNNTSVAVARGNVRLNGLISKFELVVAPVDDGQWCIVNLGWQNADFQHIHLNKDEIIKALVNRTARLLDTINMWPREQTGKGARLCVNERVIQENIKNSVLISFRANILNVPSANWQHLWGHIERRVKDDPFFKVLGFDTATVERVLPLIKDIFPSDWARARYTKAGLSGMADKFEQESEGWFPAYHLARTAHGAICRDPGWNYLVEIGLAIEELQGFNGADRLKRQLAKSPGTQHHVCLAADLHKRGFLKGLEPSTGVGAASNDLLLEFNSKQFQVEAKEFSSSKPINRLRKEIADKVKKLPRRPRQPIVFHVVLSDNGVFDKEREDTFLDAISNLHDNLSEKISAIVAGKRFVDSGGGRIKRDIGLIVINTKAIAPIEKQDLQVVFAANYLDIKYPVYGIGSFFSFENGLHH